MRYLLFSNQAYPLYIALLFYYFNGIVFNGTIRLM